MGGKEIEAGNETYGRELKYPTVKALFGVRTVTYGRSLKVGNDQQH